MRKIVLLLLMGFCCGAMWAANGDDVRTGADQTARYLPLLKGKKVMLFANHTSCIGQQHLLDVLLGHGIKVVGVLAPEHGFRGTADAGEHVNDGVDAQTGIKIYSLYKGTSGKPDPKVMKKADILVIDIQDVGLRFYTYYIAMLRLMQVCADTGTPVLLLDRPNPNGFYVDGPVLEASHFSGVGALPIPVVYGLTLGELARMINGEGWLGGKKQCKLTVIPCENYTHATRYRLPIAPSPNLPNMQSVYLYPAICLFEGTCVSLGRGTSLPFQQYGHPQMVGYSHSFTPRSVPGAKHPPLENERCWGIDLSQLPEDSVQKAGFDLSYVINAYRNLNRGDAFFTSFFEKLVGVDYVRTMIEEGCSAAEIKAMWHDDVERFKQQRRPYLLYPNS